MIKKLSVFFLVCIINSVYSQAVNFVDGDVSNEDFIIAKGDKDIIFLNTNGQDYDPHFSISKDDNKTNKKVYDVKLDIPSKGQTMILPVDKISTILVGTDIQIIYDVFNGKEKLKQCFIKTLNVNGSMLSEAKLLAETPCKSKFSIGNVNYRVIYSPDKSKFALLIDNYSKGVVIEDPKIIVFDTKKQTELSTKKLYTTYQGVNIQVDPYNNFKINNNGDINLVFNTLNEKTNQVVKSYQGDIPYTANEVKNIKEVGQGVTGSDNTAGTSKFENGRFYKSLEDYANNKPTDDFKIKAGSWGYTAIVGESCKLINKDGEIETQNLKDFPYTFFTYKKDMYNDRIDLLKVIDGRAYKMLALGKFSFYALYFDNKFLYFSDGVSGSLEKFKEKDLEERLEKKGLLEAFKKDKPKRELADDVNGYFNKEIDWYLKYIEILNKN